MKVNAIRLNNFNTSVFGSQKNDKRESNKHICDNCTKLKLGLCALGVLGAAAVGYGVLKKHNINSFSEIKNSLSDVKNIFSNKPPIDKITRKLNGKRDKEAVKIYQNIMAKEKLASLQNKILNGDFDGKSKKVFEHIRNNERLLQQQASLAI